MTFSNRSQETTSTQSEQRFLAVLLVAYVAKQLLFVVLFPAFSGHDEVAHFGYVRTLATEHRIPTLPDLDAWRAAMRNDGDDPHFDYLPDDLYPFCRYTLGWHCEMETPRWASAPPHIVTVPGMGYYPSGFQYAATHPPLYYALMSPLYLVSAPLGAVAQQYLLRLAAIPFGIILVLCAAALARLLFPGNAFLAVTTPALAAFQPQLSYEAAMVNNDIVGIALVSVITVLLVRGIRDRFPRRLCLAVGICFGLALLAKSTSVIAAPVIALAIVLAVGWRDLRGWVGRGVLVVLPAAILAAPWYAFLDRTYGNLDALPQLARLQEWWNRPSRSFLELLTDPDFVVMRFRETWGEFGWRLLPLQPALLWSIAIPVGLSLVGLVVYLVRVVMPLPGREMRPAEAIAPWRRQALVVLVVLCAAAYLAVVQFGVTFVLTQARYFFPVAAAGSLLTMLGLRTLVPVRFQPNVQVGVVVLLILLNVVILTQYVLPFHLGITQEPGYGYFTAADADRLDQRDQFGPVSLP